MSISKKTIITVCCATIILMASVYILSEAVYKKGFEDLEKQSVEKNVNQAAQALSASLDSLRTFCYDWAVWDDTYYFVDDHNQDYIDRNFQDETFTSSNLSLVLILNTAGDIVYGKSFDLDGPYETPLPDDLAAVLADNGLSDQTAREQTETGIMLVSGQPMMIASMPILNSVAEGPATGTIIMGREIDRSFIDMLSLTTHLSVNMFPAVLDDPAVPVTDDIHLFGTANPVFVQPVSKDTISGYTYVSDLAGNLVLTLKVTVPRDIYAQGMETLTLFHVILTCVGVAFCVLFILILRRFILSRLTRLSQNVAEIGASGKLSNRIALNGNDELSSLAQNINNMLVSLEKADITQHSQQELISHIVAGTPNPILAIKESGYIALANPAFCQTFHLDMAEIHGQYIQNLTSLTSLFPEIHTFIESQATSSKVKFQYRYKELTKTFFASFARLRPDNLSFMVLTDVSEEITKQERLYLTDRLVSVGEMASGIAHELNNPLTSVLSLSQLLAESDLPEDVKEDLSLIHEESRRASDIVKNMLSFARKHAPQKQLVQMNRIIEDVLKLRAYEHNVHNIKVEKYLDPTLPNVMVDYFQMQQVLINIILNAEQAMAGKNGRGTLKISSGLSNGNVKIYLADDGPGIAPENLNRIFDPFFTTKEVGKGTGLGLSICYGIITAHNGKIFVESEVNKGATFIIELPVYTGAAKEIILDEQN